MYHFYFSCFYYVVWITPTFTSRNVPYEKLNLRSCTCYVTVINTVIHASIFNYNPLESLIGEYTCNLWVCKWHNVPVTWGMSMFACCKSYMWEKGRTKEDGKRKMSRNGWQGNTSGKGGEVKKKREEKGGRGAYLQLMAGRKITAQLQHPHPHPPHPARLQFLFTFTHKAIAFPPSVKHWMCAVSLQRITCSAKLFFISVSGGAVH